MKFFISFLISAVLVLPMAFAGAKKQCRILLNDGLGW